MTTELLGQLTIHWNAIPIHLRNKKSVQVWFKQIVLFLIDANYSQEQHSPTCPIWHWPLVAWVENISKKGSTLCTCILISLWHTTANKNKVLQSGCGCMSREYLVVHWSIHQIHEIYTVHLPVFSHLCITANTCIKNNVFPSGNGCMNRVSLVVHWSIHQCG